MSVLRPGDTVGILGGGQLAQMMALTARPLGLRFAVLDPDPAAPAMAVADHREVGALDDVAAAERLAAMSNVVTLDTEHVPASLLEVVARQTPVRPGPSVLGIIQDRARQREFLARCGLPQTVNAPVGSLDELEGALNGVGAPAVLKTRRSGYDGKGQCRIDGADDAAAAWSAIGEQPAVLEGFVDFDRELSVLLARDIRGAVSYYPIAENVHRRHILHTTCAPARVTDSIARQAREIAATIAEQLEHVGVIAVELFLTRDQELLVNEIAPRTHNSGHFTWGSCHTSQFEQHVRAVCGWPLGDASQQQAAVMVNLLGDLWLNGPPDFSGLLQEPGARLHLYGKREARQGRKMGHLVLTGRDGQAELERAERLVAGLSPARA